MKKKILVADDSITIQKIVAMAFEKEDAVVEGVSNGKDAFNKMANFKPDIILADIDMPGLTGFELSKRIKDDPKLSSIKVLLLASDFEEFNVSLFNDSGADDHLSKPFKSDDIIKKVADLLSKEVPTPTGESIKLTASDLDHTVESDETIIALSADDLIEEVDSTIKLTEAELEKSIEPSAIEPLQSEKTVGDEKEDLLDEMIKDVASLKETTETMDTDYDHDEIGEVESTNEDEIGDNLDIAFQEIVQFGLGKEPGETPSFGEKPMTTPSDLETITPEPEDLLEKMTPSPLVEKKGISGPNLIQESQTYFSKIPQKSKSRQTVAAQQGELLKGIDQSKNREGNSVLGGHINQSLMNSLNNIIEKEVAELSTSITESVREIVREMTPKITREIIKEEIDKIKKS